LLIDQKERKKSLLYLAPDAHGFAAGVLFAPDALGAGAAAAARLVHVLAFATAWGAGLWVTFVGGIVMFK